MKNSRNAASVRTENFSVPESVVREVVDRAVQAHGLKRGLWQVARLLGVSERWARALHYHEPVRITADTYLRAHEARMRLLTERRAALLRELHEIEAGLGGMDARTLEPARAGELRGLPMVHVHG